MCTLNYPSIRMNLLSWVVCIHRFLDYSIELHLFHFYVKILQEPHHSLVQYFLEGYGPCKIVIILFLRINNLIKFKYYYQYISIIYYYNVKWKWGTQTVSVVHVVVVDVAIVHIELVGITVVEIGRRQRPTNN